MITEENQDWNAEALDAINQRKEGWRKVRSYFYDGVLTVWSVL